MPSTEALDKGDPWDPTRELRAILQRHGVNPSIDLLKALEDYVDGYACEREREALLESSEYDWEYE